MSCQQSISFLLQLPIINIWAGLVLESYFSYFGHRKRNLWPIAAVIPVLITGRPVITEWGEYSKFNIPTVAEYLLEQLWEC